VPALNLGGIPPFSGFIGKVALLEAGAEDGSVLAWTLVGGGVVTSGLLMAMGAFALPALIPVPVGLGLGYAALKRYGPVAARIQLGLERALDHLEQGPGNRARIPPRASGLLDLLADEVRKALKS
jgi:hypothetical protein